MVLQRPKQKSDSEGETKRRKTHTGERERKKKNNLKKKWRELKIDKQPLCCQFCVGNKGVQRA